MMYLLKKLAEKALVHPNQELTRHASAREQKACFYIGIVCCLISKEAPLPARWQKECWLGITEVAANGAGSVLGISFSEGIWAATTFYSASQVCQETLWHPLWSETSPSQRAHHFSLYHLDTPEFCLPFHLAQTSHYRRTKLRQFSVKAIAIFLHSSQITEEITAGDFRTQLSISHSNSPSVFVNTAALCNWHNCQVKGWKQTGRPLASSGRVIKGTCFWRRSQGREHVRATARLIKWLPLISTVHMKGLCLLHDRFPTTSPRDLPRYTVEQTTAGKTIHHTYGSIATLSAGGICVNTYYG